MPRALIEVGHPADVHFFKIPCTLLSEKGWEVFIIARNKAESFALLRHEGISAYKIPAHKSNALKFLGMFKGIVSTWQLARKLNVNVLAGCHPVYTSIASRFHNIPCIGFADTDHALEQIILYGPNCKAIYTPSSFKRHLGKKHIRYPGFQELSYLHPRYFKPDKGVLDDMGLLDQGPPILVRMIGWEATHDIFVKDCAWHASFIKEFAQDYRIIVSAESAVPKNLAKYMNPLPPQAYHHLLAHAALYVGPGATSCSEAAVLGTPAIYTNPLTAGTIEELESRYGLAFCERSYKSIIRRATRILDMPKSHYASARGVLLSESCDVARLVSRAIEQAV